MDKKVIPIFFSFDNNFVIPAAVAFNSMLKRAKKDIFYKMYVLHNDISEKNQNILQNIVAKNNNAQLEFKNTKGFLENEWKTCNFIDHRKSKGFTKGQFTKETVYRCFGATFFPEYDRIIYSDVDVVFMDDISELADIEFGDNYIAAVKGINNYNEEAKELDHLPGDPDKYKDTYFAGGIWVLNLDLIRKNNLEQRMLDIICDKTIYKKWNDQDVMNLTVQDKVKHISLRYISYPFLRGLIDTNPDFKTPYTKEELIESVEKPKITHYAGPKPWHFNTRNISKADIWFKELKNTGLFSKWILWQINSFKSKKIKTFLFSLKIRREKISVIILGIKLELSSLILDYFRNKH